MDIDDILRSSGSGPNKKRKLDLPSADTVLGSIRTGESDGGSAKNGASKKASVRDAVDGEDEEMEEVDTRRDFAPGGDADYFTEEDPEGRFYGGGLTSQQKQILEIMDDGTSTDAVVRERRRREAAAAAGAPAGEGDESGTLTLQGVRRQLLALEKAINKNRELRTKFENDPTKFVDSEIALSTSLHSLLLLTSDPAMSYPELIRLSTVSSLISLLQHENVDISMSVVEVLEELTDEDVAEAGAGGNGEDEEEEEGSEQARDAVRTLTRDIVDRGGIELIVDGLGRLNEDDESERNGLFHTLGLVENLLSVDSSIASTIIQTTPLLPWLLNRIKPSSKPKSKSPIKGGTGKNGISKDEELAKFQNRQYASEILAILLQNDTVPLGNGSVLAGNEQNGKGKKKQEPAKSAKMAFADAGGVDAVLTVLSTYRKRDPVDADEIEFMENVFDALCAALSESRVKELFLEGEGVELMVIMMKEKMMSRTRSIKVLDHALSGEAGSTACYRFVEALGLKTIFSAFMGKGAQKTKKSAFTSTLEDDEHILGILTSLFTNLGSDSSPRIRLLAKFVEDDYEKVDRLLEMRDSAESRVKAREGELEDERSVLQSEGLELDNDDAYLRRLEAGLFSLQMINYIIAWISMEDDGIRDHIKMLFGRNG